jgi:hypothetical protein
MRRTALSALALAAALPALAAPPTPAQCAQARQALPAQLALWRTRFAARLHFTEAQMAQRVSVTHSEVGCWNGGIKLVVRYTLRHDWARVPGQDSQPLLRTEQPNGKPVAQPVFLTPAQLASPAEQAAPDAELMPLQPEVHLAFASEQQAQAALVEALRALSRNATVSMRTALAFYVPGALPRVNGQPWMLVNATLDDAANRCASGQLNLVTGEVELHETACRVSGSGGIAG